MTTILISLYAITVIAGGILAVLKNDYFTRGFFVCLFTGIFGLIAIILSPKSKAKDGDKTDEHSWPEDSSYAILFIVFWVMVIMLIKLIV
jgi:hypothetical protein